MNNPFQTIAGMPIIAASHLTEQHWKVRKRTWKERLKWKHFTAKKIEQITRPMQKAMIADGKIYIHPAMLQLIKQHIEVSNRYRSTPTGLLKHSGFNYGRFTGI